MKKLFKKIDIISTVLLFALGAVMLMTHTWIFGIIGATYCLWLAFGKEQKNTTSKSSAYSKNSYR